MTPIDTLLNKEIELNQEISTIKAKIITHQDHILSFIKNNNCKELEEFITKNGVYMSEYFLKKIIDLDMRSLNLSTIKTLLNLNQYQNSSKIDGINIIDYIKNIRSLKASHEQFTSNNFDSLTISKLTLPKIADLILFGTLNKFYQISNPRHNYDNNDSIAEKFIYYLENSNKFEKTHALVTSRNTNRQILKNIIQIDTTLSSIQSLYRHNKEKNLLPISDITFNISNVNHELLYLNNLDYKQTIDNLTESEKNCLIIEIGNSKKINFNDIKKYLTFIPKENLFSKQIINSLFSSNTDEAFEIQKKIISIYPEVLYLHKNLVLRTKISSLDNSSINEDRKQQLLYCLSFYDLPNLETLHYTLDSYKQHTSKSQYKSTHSSVYAFLLISTFNKIIDIKTSDTIISNVTKKNKI